MLASEEHMSEGLVMASLPPQQDYTQTAEHISQRQTMPHAALVDPPAPAASIISDAPAAAGKKQTYTRAIPVAIAIIAAIALYLTWRSPATPTSPNITQQTLSSISSNSPTDTSGVIQVYIVGAVKHPGVYTLPADARVYQLLQAAGGPLPKANLVALNMAAKLTDGQEVYVTVVGEVPPTYLGGVPGASPNTANSGTLVNINTASVEEMRQVLHVSAATAQKIIDYRLQHGNYTSVDQLLQKIRRECPNHLMRG
jgi:competence protein ComEA